MGSDAAEFVNKVKDQVRSRQKRMSNVAESGEEHSIIWGMFVATTLNAATFMGKNFSTIQSVVKNHEDLTLKQMFDVTAQLVARGMGSPRHANNRRRRTCEGPEPACVLSLFCAGGGTRRERRMN